jgi:PleD family two-component response regulator
MKRTHETYHQAIKRADEAMYQAKKTGKNKVVMV